KADAVAAAGVVLVNKIILLISTTPSARAKVASLLFLSRAATPPRLRRGVLLSKLQSSPLLKLSHIGKSFAGCDYLLPGSHRRDSSAAHKVNVNTAENPLRLARSALRHERGAPSPPGTYGAVFP